MKEEGVKRERRELQDFSQVTENHEATSLIKVSLFKEDSESC